MKRVYADYLQDMLSNAERAVQFAYGMNYDTFAKDEKSVYAVIRAIEIIGEASQKVPNEVRTKYPEIPWREIAVRETNLFTIILGSICRLSGKPYKKICRC